MRERELHLNGILADLTEVYGVLPTQHFSRRRQQVPEKRLMMAILHDALVCLEKHRDASSQRGQRLFREAEKWFVANEAHWPYCFERICGVLDLDSNAVRQRLRVTP